ncbi:MAG: hypothetical protein ABSB79_16165, partial [Syntrophales bacterium]
ALRREGLCLPKNAHKGRRLQHILGGKQARAEPISAKYEQGKIHHVGLFSRLEDEMCLWIPGDPSPNRMDAMVWAFTELILAEGMGIFEWMRQRHEQEYEAA